MKRLLLIVLILLAASSQMFAVKNVLSSSQRKEIIPSDSRIVVPLSGTWTKSTDDVNWETVAVPFSENESKNITYARTIKIEKDFAVSRSWHLLFLGFNQQSEVYFNDQFVGRYYTGNSSLMIRIPDKMISSGDNELKIKLSPIQDISKQIHTQFTGAKNRFGGLMREVFLIGTPPVWLSETKYKTEFSANFTSALLKASISVSSGNIEKLAKFHSSDSSGSALSRSKSNLSLETSLIKKSTGEVVAIGNPRAFSVESERTQIIDLSFSISNPALWSPENPNLYELRAKIVQGGKTLDDFSTTVGFKSIIAQKTDSPKIILNGREVFLKSVVYVEDHVASGQSLSPWRMEEDVRMIKTLGANAIRFQFNPPHPFMAALCDRYGLMMLIDLPIYYAPSELLFLDEVRVLMRNYSKQYLSNYQNNPSLIAFGISEGLGEVNYPVELSNEYGRILKAGGKFLVYKLIPLRSKSIVSEGFDFVTILLDKNKSAELFHREALQSLISSIGKTPVLFAFGSPVQIGNHNGYSDPLSIEHQAFLIRGNYKLALDMNISGCIISTFNDYRLNHPVLATNNDEIHTMTTGLTDRSRNVRLSYNMLQALFNNEKEPLLNAGSYSESTPITFIIFGLLLVAVILFIVNRFRRFREYLIRSVLRPYNFYSDIRDQRIMSSLQTVLLGLVIAFTIGMFVASMAFYYRMSDVTQYLLMMKVPSNSLLEIIYRMIWMPELSMLMIAIIFFLAVFLVSLLIRVFAIFSRARIYYTDCLIISIWSGIPYLILLPFSIVLVRLLLISDAFAFIFSLMFIGLNIWVVLRLLKSSSVVFDLPTGQVYLIGFIILVLIIGIPLGIYELKYSIFSYLQYFFSVLV